MHIEQTEKPGENREKGTIQFKTPPLAPPPLTGNGNRRGERRGKEIQRRMAEEERRGEEGRGDTETQGRIGEARRAGDSEQRRTMKEVSASETGAEASFWRLVNPKTTM